MPYREEVAAGVSLPVVQVHGNHVELTCTFASGGTSVNVISPSFTMYQGSGVTGSVITIPEANLLVPFSKKGPGVGNYHITFMAADEWLANGEYTVTMDGTVSGSPIQILGTFTARTGNAVQSYIEQVKAALRDYDGSLYLIEDPNKFMYEDGDIYEALNRALNKINHTPPSRYTWSLDTVPWPGLIVDGAVIYALHSRGILEVPNTIQYSDEISFTIDRSQKFVTMIQVFASQWELTVGRVMRDYGYERAFPIGMGTTRIPFSTARIFSFIPQTQSFFNWGFF